MGGSGADGGCEAQYGDGDDNEDDASAYFHSIFFVKKNLIKKEEEHLTGSPDQ